MTLTPLGDAYRSVSQFHENERLVAWLKSKQAIIWLTPTRRRQILFLGALAASIAGLFHQHAHWRDYLTGSTWLAPTLALPFLLALVYLLYLAATHFAQLPTAVRRRPQISLHFLFWLIVVLAWITPQEAGIWRTVIVLIAVSIPYLIWRCGYMLMSGQRGNAAGTAFRDHLFYIWPIWGGYNNPIGKGAEYLTQCEAQSADAYARSVLAGIKLLILSRLWDLARLVMDALVYANPKNPLTPLLGEYSLDFPRMQSVLTGDAPASLLTNWVSLYLTLVWETLDTAESSHLWVGLLRLFGFNVFRNTYKPLLAESIVDFWNRYHYYFKELLVEFFFFPTYVRRFRRWQKLRIFAAVFAAAFVGNMYHHVLKEKNRLVAGALAELWVRLNPRLVYCFLLALGIYFSMLRQQKLRGQAEPATARRPVFRKIQKIAGVWTFFSIIYIWNLKGRATISVRIGFFFRLFGL
jgi:hypothetical protein